MAKVANIRLNRRSTPLQCDPGDEGLRTYDFCVVRGPDGAEMTGYVVGFEHMCPKQLEHREALPKVLRRAEPREVRAWHFLERREREALAVCKERAARYKLDMKITDVRFDDRQRKVIFHFTSDKRVDFRELVKELASHFRARIELWQVGVRDETRRMGGIGACGCPLCCAAWIQDFAPVSIKFAKAQDMQFSPSKLSGVCGRLRCCLAYEHKQYVEMAKDVPSGGALIRGTKHGEVKVIDRNLLTRTLVVLDDQGHTHQMPVDGLRRLPREEGGNSPRLWEFDGDAVEEKSAAAQETPAAAPSPDDDAVLQVRPSFKKRLEKRDAEEAAETRSRTPEEDGDEKTAPDDDARSKRRRRSRGRRRGGAGRDAEKQDAPRESAGETPPGPAVKSGEKKHAEAADKPAGQGKARSRRRRRRASGGAKPDKKAQD